MRQIIKADSITCSWPKEVSGQTLVEIDYDSLTCDGESMASAGGGQTSHGSNFMLVLLGAMLSVVGYFGFLKFQRYRVQAPQYRGGGSIHTGGGDGASGQPLLTNEIYA